MVIVEILVNDETMLDHRRLEQCNNLAAASEILGKRWSLLILDMLQSRPAHFSELAHGVRGISNRMLTIRLTELCAHGLLDRDDTQGGVVYSLTGRGKELAPTLEAMRAWGRSFN